MAEWMPTTGGNKGVVKFNDPYRPKCSHCNRSDTHDVGDHDNMVAMCSNCEVMCCGTCWDKHHASTCSLD